MDKKDALNTLNEGECIVEIQEYVLHDSTVYDVTIHTCVNITFFGRHQYDEYHFLFYFKTKELVTEFLKYWDKINLVSTSYWNSKDVQRYAMTVGGEDEKMYYLVDDFKLLHYGQFDHKCQMQKRGVWDGVVNTSGRYHTFKENNINYTDVFKYENIAFKVDKDSYLFKMYKE